MPIRGAFGTGLRMNTDLIPFPDALGRAAKLLRGGELVAMPTETVYGLAGSAFSPKAVAAIFEAKERPTFDPLIVHVAPLATPVTLVALERIGVVRPNSLPTPRQEAVNRLLAKFWPGPLTVVLPRSARIPDLVTSGLEGVGVRFPDHEAAQALIRASGTPLAAPSANRFGRISPTEARHVMEELGGRIPLVVDGGSCKVGVESTVLAIPAEGPLVLLRRGAISLEQLAEVSELEIVVGATPGAGPQIAPGQLPSHYAPRKPLRMLKGPLEHGLGEGLPADGLGLLIASGSVERLPAAERLRVVDFRSLTIRQDVVLAAQNLFRMLRELDAGPATELVVEPFPGEGALCDAIRDRLARAAAPRPV